MKSYELLEGIVHIPVASLVQEHGLHWHRESRAQCLLSQESHVALMSHNYSNVQ